MSAGSNSRAHGFVHRKRFVVREMPPPSTSFREHDRTCNFCEVVERCWKVQVPQLRTLDTKCRDCAVIRQPDIGLQVTQIALGEDSDPQTLQ